MQLIYPRFVDFEASSLRAESYPIEVAWNDPGGTIQAHLINPLPVPSWTDWSEDAQAVHGITRHELSRNGRDPAWVCECLDLVGPGQTLFSDAPEFDGAWMRELYRGSRRPPPDLRIASIAELAALGGLDHVMYARFRSEARKRAGGEHRAALDVTYLMELYRLAAEAKGI